MTPTHERSLRAARAELARAIERIDAILQDAPPPPRIGRPWRDDVGARVLAYLRETGPATIATIHAAIGDASATTVRQRVYAAQAAGLVRPSGHGRWEAVS